MDNPLVSIITPVYNGGQFIAQAINSVLNQTYSDWELLIINDGSTDKTEEIALLFNDDRIRYFKQDNKGVSAARNLALDNMKGTYFCFLDADDLLPANSLESRLSIFKQNNEIEFVEGKVETFNGSINNKIRSYSPNFEGNPFNELLSLSGNCFFGPTWMVKIVKNKTYRFDDQLTHGEDLFFYLTISTTGTYTACNELTYYYREGNDSAMTDLVSLENGYFTIYDKIKNWKIVDEERLNLYHKKIKSILWKSYLANGKITRALKVLVK